MKVYCVTRDGVLYDIFRHWEDAFERSKELQGNLPSSVENTFRVETWEVE